MKTTTENIFEAFGFTSLSENEMNEIRGGIEPPRSRDKDIYDFDEE